MESIRCKHCGKVIEGYSINHVNYLLLQHELSKHKEIYSKEQKAPQNSSKQPETAPEEVDDA